MTRKIIVIRHGQTQFNAERKLQGHCNSPLTSKGKAQALAVGTHLKSHLTQRAYCVYASSLGRAIQTAHIICDEIGFEKANVHQDDRLKEFSLGTWEEKPLFELLDEDPALLDRRDWYLKAPKAETYQDVQTRLNDWLAEIPEQEDIVVVSHGLTGIVLRGMLLGLSYDQVWAQDLPQDAFFIIQNGTIERVNCFQDKSFI
ncbi:histidine phosphatase family protein [Vibrio furnissii]|uniref:histidine phosphatase family protein n=1 Tax=Vibrio furnissii TaxID=29494 RepID=UPI003752FC1C